MSATECYADGYERGFSEENQLINFLRERRENGIWKRVKTNRVKIKAIDETAMEDSEIREEVLNDTLRNTKLLLETDGATYPVRDCAIKTILDRARISGNALSKVEKSVFAEILNYCLGVAKGDALLKISDEKLTALHGGDESDYAILEIPELFNKVIAYFERNFTGYKFEGGHFEHSMVTAVWSFPKADRLIDVYKNTLLKHGMSYKDIVPAIRFSTSDAGVSGANLYPMLLAEHNRTIALGSPLKVEHKNGASIEDFNKKLDFIYARYLGAIAELSKLLTIEIEYPLQTMMRVMKTIGITKKLAYSAAEMFKSQNGENSCTAHDLYLGINEVIFFLQCDGASGSRIVQMEENVARAMKVDWKEFDYTGEINW